MEAVSDCTRGRPHLTDGGGRGRRHRCCCRRQCGGRQRWGRTSAIAANCWRHCIPSRPPRRGPCSAGRRCSRCAAAADSSRAVCSRCKTAGCCKANLGLLGQHLRSLSVKIHDVCRKNSPCCRGALSDRPLGRALCLQGLLSPSFDCKNGAQNELSVANYGRRCSAALNGILARACHPDVRQIVVPVQAFHWTFLAVRPLDGLQPLPVPAQHVRLHRWGNLVDGAWVGRWKCAHTLTVCQATISLAHVGSYAVLLRGAPRR